MWCVLRHHVASIVSSCGEYNEPDHPYMPTPKPTTNDTSELHYFSYSILVLPIWCNVFHHSPPPPLSPYSQ